MTRRVTIVNAVLVVTVSLTHFVVEALAVNTCIDVIASASSECIIRTATQILTLWVCLRIGSPPKRDDYAKHDE